MNCLKCGKKTENEQVFCSQCLETMEAYPVKPDVHIQLPGRRTTPAEMKAGRKRRTPSPEEMVAVLRKRQKVLQAAVAMLLALVVLLCVFGGRMLQKSQTGEETEWGKNYTSDNPFD